MKRILYTSLLALLPVIMFGQYTLDGGGGAGVVTPDGVQTLTNKTLTSPILEGVVTVPTPSNASDAANKGYVDGQTSFSIIWQNPVEDIVASLPSGKPLGDRYIHSTDNHINVSDGDDTWTDLGATTTGTAVYVKADVGAPTNSVSHYNFNGSAWVAISGIAGNHNDLANIQGGSSGQYNHLTTAQRTIATQTVTTSRSGYLTDTDWDIFNDKATVAGTVAKEDSTPGVGHYMSHYDGVTGLALKANLISPVFTTPNIGSATGSVSGNAGTVTGYTPASGSLTLSGADAITLSTTNTTSLTLPTSGTLATTANTVALADTGAGVGHYMSHFDGVTGLATKPATQNVLNAQDIGGDHYVATWGSDAAAGTFDAPWATWDKAFHTAEAGDTVYFRGGIYSQYVTNGAGVQVDSRYPLVEGHEGTRRNPICYFNYPGETPILDCSNVTPISSYNKGITISFTDFLHIKGLTIRNVAEVNSDVVCHGIEIGTNCNNVIVENFIAYNIAGIGIKTLDHDSVYFKNCDVYNCADLMPDPYVPGQYGTGFQADNTTDDLSFVSYEGCRAWNCSDNGFAGRPWGKVKINNCWSFNNGYLEGDGIGFKMTAVDGADRDFPDTMRIVTNSIAACNGQVGFTTNDNSITASRVKVYNNTAYHIGYRGHSYAADVGMGFDVYNTSSTDAKELKRTFRNNLSYGNEFGEIYVAASASYTHSNNSWDASPSVTVTDADFLSVDTLELYRDRKSDGSLPDIDFMKLKSTSDLVEAGIDVGLSYNGFVPDIGAFESGVSKSYISAAADTTGIAPSFVGQIFINTSASKVYISKSTARGGWVILNFILLISIYRRKK